MSKKRFTEEFKIEAVKQVAERNHPVAEVAPRLSAATTCDSNFIGRVVARARQLSLEILTEE